MSPDATAIALIGAAAAQAYGPVGFFQHGTAIQNSLQSDEQTPQVFLFDPSPKQGGQSFNTVTMECTMCFLDTEPGDGDDPAAGEAAILRMSTLKDRFLAFLDRNPMLEIEGMQWEASRLLYSSRFTGVTLKFTLKLPRPAEASACAVV